MSLINKMLQDLEARENPAAAATPVYRDLRPVRSRASGAPWRLPVALIAVLGFGVVVYFAADRMGFALIPPTAVAAKPAKIPAPAMTAAKSRTAAPGAAAHAAPVSKPSSSPKPDFPQPKPIVAAAAEPVSPPVAPKPRPTMPKRGHKVVAPPPPSALPPDSQKKARVGIVGVQKLTPAPAHKGEREPAAVKAPRASQRGAAAKDAERIAVVDKRARPLTAEEKAETSFRRAVRLLDQGRADDAMKPLREALRAQPTHVKARELAAGLALQGGHWREAQSLLEEGLRQVPSHYPFARMLARVYIDHGAEAKALAVMESVAPEGSDDAEFSSLLALLYQRTGRHADAVKLYERSIQLRPNDARTWLGYAISLEGMQRWDAARNAYQRAKESGGLTPRLMRYADQRLAALAKH